MEIFIVCVILVSCYFFVMKLKETSEKQEKEAAEKAEEKARKEQERAAAEQKAKEEWENLLREREQKFGTLTTKVTIGYNRKEYIYVYEGSKVIFIKGQEYRFNDILSCTVEKNLYQKGTSTYTTTPDKGEMAMEELLWGMGKKYNVSSTTKVEKTPDKYNYIVYVGVNSIKEPQVILKTSFLDIANKVKSLMDVIINSNK